MLAYYFTDGINNDPLVTPTYIPPIYWTTSKTVYPTRRPYETRPPFINYSTKRPYETRPPFISYSTKRPYETRPPFTSNSTRPPYETRPPPTIHQTRPPNIQTTTSAPYIRRIQDATTSRGGVLQASFTESTWDPWHEAYFPFCGYGPFSVNSTGDLVTITVNRGAV